MNPNNLEAEKIKAENFESKKRQRIHQKKNHNSEKKLPIRSYHLESDIFLAKSPNNEMQRKIKTY